MRTAALTHAPAKASPTSSRTTPRPSSLSSSYSQDISAERKLAVPGPILPLLPLQRKLAIGAVNDPLESEADAMADRVMRGQDAPAATPSLAQTVRRKCSCEDSGKPCPKCEEEKKKQSVQRKPVSAASQAVTHAEAPPIVHDVLRSPGQPLDRGTRSFMESRFGYDLSHVRIHADSRAEESARSVNARAYTVGHNIVFAAGQYNPASEDKQRLLAHELAHVEQQGAASSPALQRAVTKDFDKLRDYLTYGVFDWAITDADAHKSLMILKSLNPTDLKDTIAAMEKEGWVDRLFSNVSGDDSKKETDLLERINDVRVHKGEKGQADLVGPCNQKQRKQIDDRVGSTKTWAREAKNRVDAFVADPAKHADTLNLLDIHFFHQKNNGALTPAQQVANATQIAGNLQTVAVQPNPLPNLCASPFDPLCASLALAYVSRKKKRAVFCSSYFNAGPQRQVYHLFHEFMHEFSGVDDRGYGDERIFAYLSPADAMNNADSYALFAVDVNDKQETSADIRLRWVPRDKVSDCGGNEPEVRRRFAFGARMITNALNIIGDPNIGAAEAQTHFKTQDRVKLQQVIDRFKEINHQFAGGMNFQCEDKCDKDETGYWRKWGWTVHLCPAWFKLSSADARTDDILLTAISEEQGIDFGPAVGTSAYTNLSEKKAYGSATAYVGYARAVTQKFFP